LTFNLLNDATKALPTVCATCAADMEMVSAEQLAILLGQKYIQHGVMFQVKLE
jgi:hypothetical protein